MGKGEKKRFIMTSWIIYVEKNCNMAVYEKIHNKFHKLM